MPRRVLAALAVAIGIIGIAAPAAADGDQIARLELTGVIDQVNATFIEEALSVAVDEGSAAAIIQIDSPGGELTSMDTIIKAILASEIPVIAWVAPGGARAGSAATFITLAADVAAMAPEHEHRRRLRRRQRGSRAAGDPGRQGDQRCGGAHPIPGRTA